MRIKFKDNFHTSVDTFEWSLLNANIGQTLSALRVLTLQTCCSSYKKAF